MSWNNFYIPLSSLCVTCPYTRSDIVKENKYISKELWTISTCTAAPDAGFKLITTYMFSFFFF